MNHLKIFKVLLFIISGFFSGVIATLSFNAIAGNAAGEIILNKLEILAQVFGQIENQYIDAISPTKLVYSAAKGVVSALDEHSAFFTPDEFNEIINITEGEYAGIGIEIDWENKTPKIITILANSPASHSDLKVGDKIVAIDDVAIADLAEELVLKKMHGPVGSKITLSIERLKENTIKKITLVRSWLRVSPLISRNLNDNIIYVQIKTFSRRVSFELKSLLAKTSDASAMVLDLRGDPGGLFDEAVAIADLFLLEGPIVTVVGRNGVTLERYHANIQGNEPQYPIAVLIDNGTASAAEIVAGSLTDRNRARLFGSKTYGKGSVQNILNLSDGSGLKLTVARYYTPSGKTIDKQGISPHEVIQKTADKDEPLDAALSWLHLQLAQVRAEKMNSGQ